MRLAGRLCVILTILIFGFCAVATPCPAADSPSVSILFFNDIHGQLKSFTIKTDQGRREVGGIARMATLIKSIKAVNKTRHIPTLTLIAGDILQGTPMSTVFEGQPDIVCFNAMGVDAITVGNHEFDFGLKNFMALKKAAAFPFLSANVAWKSSGRLVCEPFKTFSLPNGLVLTVIGITTPDLATTTKPANVKDLMVQDAVKKTQLAFEKVKHLGPVILLSHCRHKTDRAIAKTLPELAVIIAGHDHILMKPHRKVGNVPIVQAFERGRYLGRIELAIEGNTARLNSVFYLPVDDTVAPDPKVAAIIKEYNDKLGKKFEAILGRTEVFLDARRYKIRYEETNLGNWVTDIMRINTGADIAVVNGGALRASIDAGPITLEDVYQTMPFRNEIVLIKLSGAQIRKMLKRAVRATRADEDGGFLQVSGLWLTIKAQTLTSVQTGKRREPLKNDQIYTVAVSDFLASGGDGYTILTGKPVYKTGLPLRELMVETIKEGSPLKPKNEGRIIRITD